MAATLTDYQHEFAGAVVIGTGTAYTVAKVDGLGLPGQRTQDSPLPWDDGEIPGVDRSDGRLVSFEGGIKMPGDPGGALDAFGALEDIFDAPTVRTTPNAVMTLRVKFPGRPTRVLYGRPRRLDPDLTQVVVGWIPFTAEFKAHDPNIYADTTTGLTLGLDISSSSGIVAPILAPIATQATTPTSRPGVLNLEGKVATWPIIRFTGPCVNPTVRNVRTGRTLSLNVTLPAGEYIEIDTRPWNRTVLRNGTASADGALTTGSRIERFAVDAGLTEFRFTAVDATNTARMSITARAAWRRP